MRSIIVDLWVLGFPTNRMVVMQRRSKRKYHIFSNPSNPSISSSCLMGRARYAVLGAGFAGLSVAWHLLQHHPKDSRLQIDIYDEVGTGGGASGVAGGLVHPYSPKAKLLWRGAECWEESVKLLEIAEAAEDGRAPESGAQNFTNKLDGQLVQRRGIIRPALDMKNADILKENAQNCLESCRIELIHRNAAQNLVPELCVPVNSAIYMPQALTIHPKRYLQALLLACQNQVKEMSAMGYDGVEINMHKRSVDGLLELAGEYNAVIICLGAKADMLPELYGKLPLRTCRGIVAHLQLASDAQGEYGDNSPSILSNAWLAVQGPRSIAIGSTWQWSSRNYSSTVSVEEASAAMEELMPKASFVYPGISRWDFTEANAGLRAMPPLTPVGSLPLLGCVDDVVGNQNVRCKYWYFGGLGARGLLYHGWLGKLMAQAVISCDENVLPRELTSWKNKMK